MSDNLNENVRPTPTRPKSWEARTDFLVRAVMAALNGKASVPVNLTAENHAVIEMALHRVCYEPSSTRGEIPLLFMDGSRLERFPIENLRAAGPAANVPSTPAVKIGLMSFRHPEMDYLVEYYLCRNRELALQASMADEEAHAFQRAREFLNDPQFEKGGRVEVYHTGLEPMVVGFYRAVIEVLALRHSKHMPNLTIYPKLFTQASAGGHITPKSAGAQAEDYLEEAPWQ